MDYSNYENLEEFLFDISNIPGSSDDVVLLAIQYYSNQENNPNIPQDYKNIARSYAGHLKEYYEMSNLDSPHLREALQHFSNVYRFMQGKVSIDMDCDSSCRIKSLYSLYPKIGQKIVDCIGHNKPLPEQDLLFDIYATREVLSPRYDMKHNPEEFYKLTYKTIYDYMEYIDSLSQKDPRYSLVEQSKNSRRKLRKPKLTSYKREDVTTPEKVFNDYILESLNIPIAYKYLSELPNNLSASELQQDILCFKEHGISDSETKSTTLYSELFKNIQKDLYYQLRDTIEEMLLSKLNKNLLVDYKDLPINEFASLYQNDLKSFELDCCKFIDYIDKYIEQNYDNCNDFSATTMFPQFQNDSFKITLNNLTNQYSEESKEIFKTRLEELANLDLTNFEYNLEKARKIEHYSHCCKDYMKYPKASGYQSLHIITKTPFGYYEKQFRTEDQHNYAEYGPASHSTNYKPDIKTSFHRLKVPKIITPKRDQNGDIIMPIDLGILPFEDSVRLFYGTPFKDFSGGKTFEELKAAYPDKVDFDRALFELTPPPEKDKNNKFITKIKNMFKMFFKETKKAENIELQIVSSPSTAPSYTDHVPNDITVYPKDTSTLANTNKSVSIHSTDSSIPHDDNDSYDNR